VVVYDSHRKAILWMASTCFEGEQVNPAREKSL